MHIKLVGYNVNVSRSIDFSCFTPEVLSAAYARISRSSDSLEVLRRKAAENISAARKSNEKIVFDMGHASIAEHAVFNFDMEDVSRLAVEYIEHSRLASYTEKSQRYVTFNPHKREYYIPEELSSTSCAYDFERFLHDSYRQYHHILEEIKKQQRPQGGLPEEDARYVTPLATTTSLGMTINGRSLEAMIRRLLASPLHEVKLIGQTLYDEVKEVAPSLFRYETPEPLRQNMLKDIRSVLSLNVKKPLNMCNTVNLLWAYEASGADNRVLASLVYQAAKASFSMCYTAVQELSTTEKRNLLRKLVANMEAWTAMPRQWELVPFTFEIVCSASCFAQLKRHRMATIIPQAYDPSLGCVVPESIKNDAFVLRNFHEMMCASNELYYCLKREFGADIAQYALTQAHQRRIIVNMNARELYHFSRLRQDGHAQWEIRDIADKMISIAKDVSPLTMALACGKDVFEEVKSNYFNR
ncbi:MAG: FAD-dependent thymidylate synthase [Desulfobacteraceae bacterium]|jgi:flavin-dependent thymidylate synthase